MEELFFSKFQNKESQSSYLYSKEVAQLIKEILKVYFKEQKSVDEILKAIQNLHNSITPHKPTEFSIGNVIKRITSIIREQAKAQGLSSRTEEVEREKQESKPIKLIKVNKYKINSFSECPHLLILTLKRPMEEKKPIQKRMKLINKFPKTQGLDSKQKLWKLWTELSQNLRILQNKLTFM